MTSASTELAALRALRPDTLRIRLIAKSTMQLREMASRLGAEHVVSNRLLQHDHCALRASLIEWIADGGGDGDGDDADDDTDPEVILQWLKQNADKWPAAEGEPAAAGREVDDKRWTAAARGYEVRLCDDDPSKGMGVFATRPQRRGSVVGVYWGETLTRREYVCRHGWRDGAKLVLSDEERAAQSARRARLDLLVTGAPSKRGDGEGRTHSLTYRIVYRTHPSGGRSRVP